MILISLWCNYFMVSCDSGSRKQVYNVDPGFYFWISVKCRFWVFEDGVERTRSKLVLQLQRNPKRHFHLWHPDQRTNTPIHTRTSLSLSSYSLSLAHKHATTAHLCTHASPLSLSHKHTLLSLRKLKRTSTLMSKIASGCTDF